MNIKVFGKKMRLEIILLFIALGFILNATMFCSCLRKEGMSNIDAPGPQEGVHNEKYNEVHNRSEMYQSPEVPLPEGQLFMYANNTFKPECCKFSSVGGSTGCACETKEQKNYIASRGGNKSGADGF